MILMLIYIYVLLTSCHVPSFFVVALMLPPKLSAALHFLGHFRPGSSPSPTVFFFSRSLSAVMLLSCCRVQARQLTGYSCLGWPGPSIGMMCGSRPFLCRGLLLLVLVRACGVALTPPPRMPARPSAHSKNVRGAMIKTSLISGSKWCCRFQYTRQQQLLYLSYSLRIRSLLGLVDPFSTAKNDRTVCSSSLSPTLRKAYYSSSVDILYLEVFDRIDAVIICIKNIYIYICVCVWLLFMHEKHEKTTFVFTYRKQCTYICIQKHILPYLT